MMRRNEADLRAECCHIGCVLSAYGWAPGSSGNISVRLDDDRILITPSGAALGELKPGELIPLPVCEGSSYIDSSVNLPSSELPMHRAVFQHRSGAGAVIHVHPPYTIALSITGFDFRRTIVPETVLSLGEIGVAPYALPASRENAQAITDLAKQYEAIVLTRHGSLTIGENLTQALHRLEALEGVAETIHLALQLGEISDLPAAEVGRLREHRQNLQEDHSL